MSQKSVSKVEQKLSSLKNQLEKKAEEYGLEDLRKVSIPTSSPEDRILYQLMVRGVVEVFQENGDVSAYVKKKSAGSDENISQKGREVLEWMLRDSQESLLVFLLLAEEGWLSEDEVALGTLNAFEK